MMLNFKKYFGLVSLVIYAGLILHLQGAEVMDEIELADKVEEEDEGNSKSGPSKLKSGLVKKRGPSTLNLSSSKLGQLKNNADSARAASKAADVVIQKGAEQSHTAVAFEKYNIEPVVSEIFCGEEGEYDPDELNHIIDVMDMKKDHPPSKKVFSISVSKLTQARKNKDRINGLLMGLMLIGFLAAVSSKKLFDVKGSFDFFKNLGKSKSKR